ncbi:MAG TPA: VanZ family protein [Candidatus Scatomorpha gallistercoris]|nr:VanZ family protein [Candidatus Scatomorpha gallistercoris]
MRLPVRAALGESRKRFLVIALGALASLLAETLQYVIRLGIFDVDDLLNNTLGTLCGFALARCRSARTSVRPLCGRASTPA